MTARRGLLKGWGVGIFLFVLATIGAPAALGARGSLEWNPPAYDFGPVPYGTGPSEPQEFILTNTSDSQVVFQNWRYRYGEAWPESDDPFWSPAETSSPCVHALGPGASCSIELVFDPLHPGIWWSAVRVRGEGEELWTELSVSGEGSGPWVPVTPSRLTFESVAVGMTTAPRTITVENQDPKSFEIEGLTTTPVGSWPASSTPFKVIGGTCYQGQSIEPGKTCTIEVAMSPTVAGLLQSKLEVTDNAPDSPQSVRLEGTAIEAPEDQQLPTPAIGVTAISPPPASTPSAHTNRNCARGKRSVVRKSRRICVKKRKLHRRH